MGHRVLLRTAPATEPVTTAELKAHCRIDSSDDDTLLAALITAARQRAETLTGLSFITTAWTDWLDEFPRGDVIRLHRGPLLSVSLINTYDGDGVATAWTDYDTAGGPVPLVSGKDFSWPTIGRRVNGVEIQYTAGYGTSASDVPQAIRHGIMHIAAALYENRGDTGDQQLPATAIALLTPYRRVML